MPNGFFQDEKGNYSFLRLQTAFNCIFSYLLGLYAVVYNPSSAQELAIFYLVISTGGKVWQKQIESTNLPQK